MKDYLHKFLKEKPFFFSIVRPKEADLYQRYKPFKRPILDLGCGDGFFAQVAFGKVDVGIDPDKSVIKEAKFRKIYQEVKPYNGRTIPYENDYFSTVLCNSTFEHIQNLKEVLNDVIRVLKTGGILYFTVPTDQWPQYLFGNKILGKKYEEYFVKKSNHYNLYFFYKWKEILSQLGFEVVYHTHYLDNKKIMWLFDISHYLSISSLITKKIFNRWVLFPGKVRFLGFIEDFLSREINKNTSKGPYLFIAAKKNAKAFT